MKNKIIIISLLLSGLFYAQQQIDIPWATLAKSDWPMIKHDPQFTGRTPYKGPQTPTVIWTRDMPDGIFSGPVIGKGGDLFFGSYFIYADYFYSYTADGSFIWNYETGNGRAIESGIVIDSSGTIYFGSRDSCLYALNPDGTFKWKYNTSGSILSDVILNIDLLGNIYLTNFISIATDEGKLFSIKPDGTLNWEVFYESGFAGQSPVFSPDGMTIYIAGLDSNLFALNLDGSIKWKFNCGKIIRAPMVDAEGNIYFTPTEESQFFYSLKPDKSVRWKYKLPFGIEIFSIPTIDYEGNLYSIGLDSVCCPLYLFLFSLDYDGNFRWKYLFDETEQTEDIWQPLICDVEGTIYVGSTIGYYYYAISSAGELKWKIPLNDFDQQVDNTGAISKDGTLYLGVHNTALVTGQKETLIAIRDTSSTGVKDNINIVGYKLMQNYPNPFNPSTVISYQLPVTSNVVIEVFDVLGNKVATLVNDEKPSGSYEVEFNATGLTSGIYFYKLQAGEFIETKKLIFLK